MGIKYKVNENFFDSWNKEMAYILGFLYADGSMEDASYLRGKYIRATSTDKWIILTIKKLLESQHKILALKPRTANSKTRYFIRIGNHKLYDSLLKCGLQPRKSLTMKFPKIPKALLNHFIRGYFDGDGCAHIYLNKVSLKPKQLKISFTSGSKIFLQQLESILRNACRLKCRMIYNSHRAFQLCYPSHDGIKIFKFLYNNASPLFFKRKLNIFAKYFKMIKNKDLEAELIIENINNNGLVAK